MQPHGSVDVRKESRTESEKLHLQSVTFAYNKLYITNSFSVFLVMDQNQQFQYCASELKAVAKEIKEILKLTVKVGRSGEETTALEFLKSRLAESMVTEREWSARVYLAQQSLTKIAEELYTFRGVDNRVIASIAGVNTVRKLWTYMALDESVVPS
jgi:polyribonucleotide nucleotidyltransferase